MITHRTAFSVWATLIILLSMGSLAWAQTCVSPEAVGLSPERLERIQGTFQGLVEEGNIAGALTLISRKGQVAHWETYGYMDLAMQNAPFGLLNLMSRFLVLAHQTIDD